MVADEPELILHLGDYIYELSWGDTRIRSHDSPECHSLDDYRARYALYKSDPLLKAAHAACPWLLTWDDHEVENDYAADVSEEDDGRNGFSHDALPPIGPATSISRCRGAPCPTDRTAHAFAARLRRSRQRADARRSPVPFAAGLPETGAPGCEPRQ